MAPKDLKTPFRWETRQVMLADRVLFVPKHYSDYNQFTLPPWEHHTLFGNTNPVRVEYCSGHGHWIIEKALQNPTSNWVAVEIRFDRVRRIWSKLKNHNLSNLLICCGDGRTITREYFPKASVDEVFVNFPDPWPKTCHAKHRLIQPPFIEECARILKKGAQINLVTDDAPYSKQMIKVVSQNPCFESPLSDTSSLKNVEGYGGSFFFDLWKKEGRTIHHLPFKRTNELLGEQI